MSGDERPTVSLTEARRRDRRAFWSVIAFMVALVVAYAFGAPHWLATGLGIGMGLPLWRSIHWSGYIAGRRAADTDAWRRQRERRL